MLKSIYIRQLQFCMSERQLINEAWCLPSARILSYLVLFFYFIKPARQGACWGDNTQLLFIASERLLLYLEQQVFAFIIIPNNKILLPTLFIFIIPWTLFSNFTYLSQLVSSCVISESNTEILCALFCTNFMHFLSLK
jgi:hypothetical protein